MPMVIYGLGSIQCSYAARFQLAYALLLREVAELKIDREITICCDDISSNPVEEKAIKAHGCKVVLMTDGRFRWTADDPTLFFLPFTRTEVLGDLLEVNWCPSRLERMIILGRSLELMAETLDEMVSTSDMGPKMTVKKLTYVMDRLRYVWGIREHTIELEIEDTSSVDKSQGYSPEEMFQNMYWHVFDFAGVEDMDILLPSTENCFKWVDCSTSYPYRMDEEDVKELPRLQHEMEVTIMDLRESEYYLKLRDDLNGDQLLRSEISRRIGSKEHVQMGGMTSLDLATKALQAKRAKVIGHALAGVPLWQLGNVGDNNALTDVVKLGLTLLDFQQKIFFL
ncbi:hypothetical protein J5N97_009571 [Dioscorea zingiberensis]|uniref:SRR1-like domain-containing protein n=1 Tax=Dioscorea zingiberensis TaxID=325984 RepID=A0A9D5HM22_9LILI|nr:hypothetical protein J5N97_009571 [Dioscorea zingiberensis]